MTELSSDRVLTMELAEGLRWSRALTADAGLRDRWGEAIHRFTIGTLRRVGLFHADPHPGNYLFHEDGMVTFLDFGCVKPFTPNQVRQLRAMVTAAVDDDPAALAEAMRDAGFTASAGDASPDPAVLLRWFRTTLHSMVEPQPYTYSPERTARFTQAAYSPGGEYMSLLLRLTLPPDLLFLTRIELGMDAVLGGLRATGPWRDICDEWDRGAPPATAYGELDQAFWKEHHDGRSLC